MFANLQLSETSLVNQDRLKRMESRLARSIASSQSTLMGILSSPIWSLWYVVFTNNILWGGVGGEENTFLHNVFRGIQLYLWCCSRELQAVGGLEQSLKIRQRRDLTIWSVTLNSLCQYNFYIAFWLKTRKKQLSSLSKGSFLGYFINLPATDSRPQIKNCRAFQTQNNKKPVYWQLIMWIF